MVLVDPVTGQPTSFQLWPESPTKDRSSSLASPPPFSLSPPSQRVFTRSRSPSPAPQPPPRTRKAHKEQKKRAPSLKAPLRATASASDHRPSSLHSLTSDVKGVFRTISVKAHRREKKDTPSQSSPTLPCTAKEDGWFGHVRSLPLQTQLPSLLIPLTHYLRDQDPCPLTNLSVAHSLTTYATKTLVH